MLVRTRFTISLSQKKCATLSPWVGQIKRRSNNIGIKLSLNKKTAITPSINQNRGIYQRNLSDLDFKHVSSNRGTQLDIRHFAKTSADITREEQDRKKRAKVIYIYICIDIYTYMYVYISLCLFIYV